MPYLQIICKEKQNELSDVKPSTIRTWQKFIDFLLRQLSQVSLKYTDWENDEFDCFCRGLNFVEALGIKGSAPAMTLSDLRKQAKLLGEHKGEAKVRLQA